MTTDYSQPTKIAAGVHLLQTGRSRFISNVYFVTSRTGWILVDSGWPGSQQSIIAAAEWLFGRDVGPKAIVLTHSHLDHIGSVPELAQRWGVPVHVHAAEVSQAQGELVEEYANPLDQRVLHPLMKFLPSGTMQTPDLSDVIRAIDLDAGLPGLPDWWCVPTPGHTPGHIALFREADGVLLAGDAVLTMDVNSVSGVLTGRQQIGGPPRLTTWDRTAAESSVRTLADLHPHVLGTGHGIPLTGHDTSRRLSDFAAQYVQSSQSQPTLVYRRVAAARSGGPEELQVVSRQLRSPRRGEVRVRVETASVSTVDVQARQGLSTTPPKFPLVPGYAVVGEVDAVGQGVTAVAPGNRVVVLTETGGYSEYVFVDRHPMMRIPAHLDAAEAVVVVLNYLVAHQTLSRSARIRPGQKILITGAAGGIGTALVQLGQLLNLTMYGVDVSSKHPWLAEHGVIPLERDVNGAVSELLRMEPEGVDVVLEGLGGAWVEHGLSVLSRNGVLVEYANPGSPAALGRLLRHIARHKVTPGGPRIALYGTTSWRLNRQPLLKAWSTLYRLLEDRKIEPVIAARFPLAEAAQAHERLEHGDVIGNLVLDVWPGN